MLVSRMGSGLLHTLNRHALDLDRALDVEATAGKLCVPEDIRGSKLYEHLLGNRPEAFRERHTKIVEADENLVGKWRPNLPNFAVEADWWDNADDSDEDDSESGEPIELDGLED